MIEHSVVDKDNTYHLDTVFDQPDGNIVQQELITYIKKDGVLYKQCSTRRFTDDDYIDSYTSVSLLNNIDQE